MSLVDLSTTAASNNAAAPTGAPEGSFLLGDVSNTFRELMAVVRSLAASDTIAAAATTDLGSKTYATFLTLTGTATTITALGTVSAGIYKFVVYNAAHSVTHNATSLIMQGGASRTVANGDVSLFVSLGSGNWRELFYSGGAYQPLDADLTAIAALTTQAYGRSLLEVASEAAFKALVNLEIGTDVLAYVSPGTSGNVLTSNGTAWTSATPTASSDEKTKVSSNDTTPGYLNGKLVAGTNITLTEGSDGANETLTIASSGISSDVGAGGVGMMAEMLNGSASSVNSGATIAGSSLKYMRNGADSGVVAAGTWRNISGSAISSGETSAFQRIS